jgi:GNAT superfamily N-acetyltransferase
MIEIQRCTSENKDFRNLVLLLDSDLNSRYGLLQAQYEAYNKIESNNTVIVAYDEGKPVGCGCYKQYDGDSVEIKRMFTIPESRGKGIAKRILTELEKWAAENGFKNAVLETGSKQHEAINFYSKFGYTRIENYGQYAGNTNSICMRKELNINA